MPNLSLGTIEVYGLPAAVEAADVALKTADVALIGYETTDGMGMVAVKIEGQVSAVQSAIHAACAAASKVSKVFATSVIPRPSTQLEPVVLTDVTVGLAAPDPVEALVEEAVAEAVIEAIVEEAVEEAIVEAVVEEAVEEAIVEAAVEEAVEEAIVEAVVEEAVVDAAAEEPPAAPKPRATRTRKAASSRNTTRTSRTNK